LLRYAGRSRVAPRPSRGGFTLIEVMIALGIFSLGIGGVLAIFMAAAATHRRALDETTAAIVAEGAVAEVRSEFVRSGFAEPRDKTGPEPAAGFPLCSYEVRTTVLERDPATGRAVQTYVEVAVSWQRQGRRREEVYRTILFRE
jgi:prepilin-type N-terminal cleavage/methylation domain-containing protein